IGDPKGRHIVLPPEWALVADPAIDIEINEVAILRGSHHAREQNRAGGGVLGPEHRLIDDSVNAGVTAVKLRHPVAERADKRLAETVDMLVCKGMRIVPGAEPVRTGARQVVGVVAYLGDGEGAVVGAKRGAREIVLLRVGAKSSAGWVAVEH